MLKKVEKSISNRLNIHDFFFCFRYSYPIRQYKHFFLSQYSFFSWMSAWLSPAWLTFSPHWLHIRMMWLFSGFNSSRKEVARRQSCSLPLWIPNAYKQGITVLMINKSMDELLSVLG